MIRSAKTTDYQEIVRILEEADLPTLGVSEWIAHFVVASPTGSERVLAVAGMEVHRPDAVLRSVAVRTEARGEGLGSALTRHLLEKAEVEGLRHVYLLTETAEAFFPRFGFRPVSRTEVSVEAARSVEFRGLCPESATVMRREGGDDVRPE